MLIFYKTIDKSVFASGFAIPVMYKDMLFDNLGFALVHGEKMSIDILIDDCIYKATLMNIDFDQKAHPNHKDILQVRYGANSPLAKKLREKFGYTENLINSNSNLYSYKWLSALPEDQKEFMAIYSTDHRGVMMLDCITNKDFREESKELVSLGESVAEHILDGTDPNSGITLKTKVCKIRRLTATVLRDLKILYGYRCQVCGLRNQFNLNPIVLLDQPDQGLTIIEKFEKYATTCSYAFALFTPDDIVTNGDVHYFQARPNVIFELGWFYANLGRSRVCILDQASEQSKIFSDLQGILRMQFNNSISERYMEIERELKSVNII